jgi:hypothetical protein
MNNHAGLSLAQRWRRVTVKAVLAAAVAGSFGAMSASASAVQCSECIEDYKQCKTGCDFDYYICMDNPGAGCNEIKIMEEEACQLRYNDCSNDDPDHCRLEFETCMKDANSAHGRCKDECDWAKWGCDDNCLSTAKDCAYGCEDCAAHQEWIVCS